MVLRRAKGIPRKRKRFGRGVLLLLSILMLSSGILRIGVNTGAAVARDVANAIDSDQTASTTEAGVTQCEPAPEIANLLSALQTREKKAEQREAAIKEELLALNRAREEIAREMAALEQAETQLEATLALADGAAENDLAKLTRVYETMKPKEASKLFEEMDPNFAAGFLGRMQPARAAAIMAGIEPRAAYTISLVIAGRNSSAPTE